MSGILQSLLASFPSGPAGFFLYGWGRNNYGQLGDQTIVTKSSPVQIGALFDWSMVSAGSGETAAIKTDGTLWTWGHNSLGQLGHGDVIRRSSPVQVGALTDWATASIGSETSNYGQGGCLAVKTNGTLWGWGLSYIAGQGVATNFSSPVQIGANTNWASVSTCFKSAFGVTTSGALYAWGGNGFGRLGLNNSTYYNSPVQVGALTNWASIGQGSVQTFARKTNGTLWSWGRNANGELGLGDRINRSSPVQVGALTTWTLVEGGPSAAAAIDTSNRLWTWGWNYYGWLGHNDKIARSSPVQVGSLTNWKDVAIGEGTSMAAVKTDGTLWSWGSNSYGALGQNNTTKRSSPVQVGSQTNWESISSNMGGRFMALKS